MSAPQGYTRLGSEKPRTAELSSEDVFTHKTKLDKARETLSYVCFLMVHRNHVFEPLEYLLIWCEDLQFLMFFFAPNAAFSIPSSISSFAEVQYQNMDPYRYIFFFLISSLCVLALGLSMIYVGVGIASGHHRMIWPLRLARLLATFLPSVLFFPILGLLTSAMNRISTPWPMVGVVVVMLGISLREFLMVLIAIITIACYIPVSLCLTLVFHDINPIIKGPTSKAHGRVDFFYCIIKVITTTIWRCTSITSPSGPLIRSLTLLVASILLLSSTLLEINHMRVGTYVTALFIGMINVLAAISFQTTGIVLGNTSFIIMASALIPLYAAGFMLSHFVFGYIQKSTIAALGNQAAIKSDPNFLVFQHWTHVEITARYYLADTDARRSKVSPLQLDRIIAVFKRGTKEFPSHPMILASYANYLYNTQSIKLDGERLLSKIYALQPAPDIKFHVYYLSQIISQEHQEDVPASLLRQDASAFAEYQKELEICKSNYMISVQKQTVLWQLLCDKNHSSGDLETVAMELYNSSLKADGAFKKLLGRYPKAKSILKNYAMFCTDIMQESSKARILERRLAILEGEDDENRLGESPITDSVEKNSSGEEDSGDSRSNIESSSIDQNSKQNGGSFSSIGRKVAHDGKKMQAANKLRKSLLKHNEMRITTLRYASAAVGFISAVIFCASFVVSIIQLQVFNWSLTLLNWLKLREYYTALQPLRLIQMRVAYQNNDSVTFNNIQTQFRQELYNFSSVSEDLYFNRYLAGQSLDPGQIITVFLLTLPSIQSLTPIQGTIYSVTQGLISSAWSMLDLGITDFANVTSDPNYRFIMDNAWTIQETAYQPSSQVLFTTALSESVFLAKIFVYLLTVVQIVMVMVLIVLFDRKVGEFRRAQKSSLRVFRQIPQHVSLNTLQKVRQSGSYQMYPCNEEDSSGYLLGHNSLRSQKGKAAKHQDRWFYMAYMLTTVGLSVAFAYLNISSFDSVLTNATDISQVCNFIMDMINSVALLSSMSDVPFATQSWGTVANAFSVYSSQTATMTQAYRNIKFGDAIIPLKFFQYPPFVVQMLTGSAGITCLPYDSSLCQLGARNFNNSIGYSYESVTSGLFRLSNQMLNCQITQGMVVAAGRPISAINLAFVKATLEPDFVQGWLRIARNLNDSTQSIMATFENSIIIISLLSIAVIVVGQVLVLQSVIRSIKLTDLSMIEMIIRLPLEAKERPEFADMAKTVETPTSFFGRIFFLFVQKKSKPDSKRRDAGPTSSKGFEHRRRSVVQPIIEFGSGQLNTSPSYGSHMSTRIHRRSDVSDVYLRSESRVESSANVSFPQSRTMGDDSMPALPTEKSSLVRSVPELVVHALSGSSEVQLPESRTLGPSAHDQSALSFAASGSYIEASTEIIATSSSTRTPSVDVTSQGLMPPPASQEYRE
ncbi:uncharacterized protein BJ171DRAFT_601321 [Polychytrium aggregatum]|uniref:uncharacterized protein n=1 Tax=Polychytrium aggregatum TaxID=110093 RepID=UPI0022FDF804|nr:uncharacterized protein BJ171DRAFT_601321 [Polychytrium aggregatum]KAI9201962.1 hypothetical protein BJ171DRAFT_601321 [Polychytrium aggregatum]